MYLQEKCFVKHSRVLGKSDKLCYMIIRPPKHSFQSWHVFLESNILHAIFYHNNEILFTSIGLIWMIHGHLANTLP